MFQNGFASVHLTDGLKNSKWYFFRFSFLSDIQSFRNSVSCLFSFVDFSCPFLPSSYTLYTEIQLQFVPVCLRGPCMVSEVFTLHSLPAPPLKRTRRAEHNTFHAAIVTYCLFPEVIITVNSKLSPA